MSRRRVAAILYVTAGAVAALETSPLWWLLVTGCVATLTLGYRYRSDLLLVVSGWFLYFPMAMSMAPIFGGFWCYLAAGTLLAVISERLSFENRLSLAVESQGGVDSESKQRADELSGTHLRRLEELVAVVAALACGSVVLSLFVSAVIVLILSSVLLLVAVGLYANRLASNAQPRDGREATF
ncbi:MAG TPA: hypothetical protein VEJ36_01620 [Nitrososphaerales archaeon]|nr:hypothetical protein [Nitrososphaerales archaeon]